MATKFPMPSELPARVIQEPTEGGSYIRNADGTLTLVQQTQDKGGRAVAAQEAQSRASIPEPFPVVVPQKPIQE